MKHTADKIAAPRAQKGVTLMELMIVLAVIGIMGAIAYPNYKNYVQRSARSEGKAALMTLASKQEQYFTNNKTYAANLADVNMTALTEGGKYQLEIVSATSNAYSLRAVPQGGQTQDTDCANLTLDSKGTKGASGSLGAECW